MDNKPEVLIAADVVRQVVEGDTRALTILQERFAGHHVLLLDACLCEGLESAEAPTAEGLSALAAMIRIADMVRSG
jgi:hypothetical protein